jgi:hypothetical protein
MTEQQWTTRPNETFGRANYRTMRQMDPFAKTTQEDLDRLAAGETPRQVWPGDDPIRARS